MPENVFTNLLKIATITNIPRSK